MSPDLHQAITAFNEWRATRTTKKIINNKVGFLNDKVLYFYEGNAYRY